MFLTVDESITLRPFQLSDKSRLIQFGNNPKVSINLGDGFPYPYTEAAADTWLSNILKENPPTVFVIAEDNLLIGGTGYHPLNDVYRFTAEIGYWLAEPYWGKGIVTNVVRVLVDYVFEHHQFNKLFAGVFSTNPASARVLEKNRFKLEGTLRESVIKRGVVQDELRYGLLRSEWEARHSTELP